MSNKQILKEIEHIRMRLNSATDIQAECIGRLAILCAKLEKRNDKD